jgi:acyl-CoA synthetase (AMP-forming)/AMP-acid ligase II
MTLDHLLLPNILTRHLEEGRGSEVALYFEDARWSFDDLANRAGSIAQLSLETTQPGQSVAVLGANHPDWVAAYYGVSATNRLLCFLNHRLAPLELIEQLGRANAGLLLVHPDSLRVLEPFMDQLDQPLCIVEFDAPLDVEQLALDGLESTSPTWLMFTSGTTGKPKGVLLSHDNLFASFRAASHARFVNDADIYAYTFPLCHVAGYNVPRLHVAGRPVVLLERFTPGLFIENVERHQVNSATVAATMLASLLHHLDDHPDDVARLATLETLSYGASPMPANLLTHARSLLGLKFSQGFGMSEMAGNALFLDIEAHEAGFARDSSLLVAAGLPGPGVEAKIVDGNDELVEPGSPGELCIRGAQVMVGYLADDEATHDALRGGWLHSGDLAIERTDGNYQIVDRLKDTIVTGGENVASLEVERTLRSHCPEIADVAIIGVPDPTWGENVCACVSLRAGASLTLDQIARRLTDVLAGYKIPRHVVFFDALPQTHSGKAAKAELRALFADDPELLGPRRG